MLIHFTKSLEALDSITSNGLLYLHNETGVLGPALKDAFGIKTGDSQSNGMICFTDIHPEATASHQSMYGEFGIGISKDWLVKNGARKVVYVEVPSQRYEAFVNSLRETAPATIKRKPLAELLHDKSSRFEITQILSGNLWSESEKSENLPYLEVLVHLSWTQTHKDIAESEWRIRNPRPYRFTGNPSRTQKIQLLTSCIRDPNVQDVFDGLVMYTIDGSFRLSCVGKTSLALPIPKEEIRALFCPLQHLATIKHALQVSNMEHIPVYVRMGDVVVGQ